MRRAKLFYLRDLVGKKARLRQRFMTKKVGLRLLRQLTPAQSSNLCRFVQPILTLTQSLSQGTCVDSFNPVSEPTE